MLSLPFEFANLMAAFAPLFSVPVFHSTLAIFE